MDEEIQQLIAGAKDELDEGEFIADAILLVRTVKADEPAYESLIIKQTPNVSHSRQVGLMTVALGYATQP